MDKSVNYPVFGNGKTIVRVCQVSKYLLQSAPTTNSFSVRYILEIVNTVTFYTFSITVRFGNCNISIYVNYVLLSKGFKPNCSKSEKKIFCRVTAHFVL